ncbi:TetR/AcrR family transcriptional regulator [Nocardia cerradoensis]|uniref:TetR/AcrR family transcriptional regulator n=1 Tax=Nocardia cerradoensis TaxID=85688 RepID=UPI0002F72C06|nr:TetR/AcrR family transcriptional regulator [Nocardia cerradoensis]NKY45310.1 TetR/AcrR family transcriptional regulator [Nocardia cerradoensis]
MSSPPSADAGFRYGVRAPAPGVPGTRIDARRNRARILAAAQRAFAESGTSVSLAEIARRAGVGAGTVHRHFPTKTDLLEAVLQQRIDRLTARALMLRDDPDPAAAFLGFCAEVVTRTPGNKAMCDLLDADDGWPRMLLRDAGERFHLAVGQLLEAARRAGGVRADLTLADVLAIFTGCVAMQRVSNARDELSRPAALLLAAMRADSAVTKPANFSLDRNETTVADANRDSGSCPICGADVAHAETGRPARYCSPACRQKAHRLRRAASAAGRDPVGTG